MATKLGNLASKLSLGIVLVLVWAWMYLRADLLFPVNTEAWKDIIQTYILFTALIFSFNALASDRTEKVLFRVSFIKAFPKFVIASVITFIILLLFNTTITGEALPSIYSAISGIGLGVILLHAFFVATLEEKVFRSWLTNELLARGMAKYTAWIFQAFVFAMFHYMLNGEWMSIIIYVPLGLAFMFIKEKWSPRTDMANSGSHFAWNMWILGFMS